MLGRSSWAIELILPSPCKSTSIDTWRGEGRLRTAVAFAFEYHSLYFLQVVREARAAYPIARPDLLPPATLDDLARHMAVAAIVTRNAAKCHIASDLPFAAALACFGRSAVDQISTVRFLRVLI